MRWKQYLLTCAVALMLLGPTALTGCAKPQAEAVPYHGHALHNFHLGRKYQAQGRYEMARDRFLQALATAEDADMRARLAREIQAADKLIELQR
ncbi:MAG: hypothetical protein SVS15_06100 [Thermodesulfobacteriota bacterium]|nr:hypothetical protein [Thermodesulfobacteriota bacterium]